MRARYLIDKSALARMPLAPVRSRLAPIIEAGEAATCSIIDLEVLYSARNAEDHERIRQRRSSPTTPFRSARRSSNAPSTFRQSWPGAAVTACPFPI